MTLNRSLLKIYFIFILICASAISYSAWAQEIPQVDTTGTLPYPFEDQPAFGYSTKDSTKIYLNKPSNISYQVEYDPVLGQYVFYEKIGDLNYRLPQSMSLEEYIDYDFEKSVDDYWRSRNQLADSDSRGGMIPKLTVGSEAFNRVFGGNTIDIQAQGYVEVSFGYSLNKTENPSISEDLRSVSTFDFDEEIQMSVTGQIGTKMDMKVNYNTEATFDYENKISMEYTGDEDEILQNLQAGDVSFPLNGTLITGVSDLFGVKADMQFGKLNVTTVFSQVESETSTVETDGGSQYTSFEISAADYDAKRHFFLSHYFRDKYDEWLKNTAAISSPIVINKVEVWVTNTSGDYSDARNILAFNDLGEHDPYVYNDISQFQETSQSYPDNTYPNNEANGIYSQFSDTYSDVRTVSNISTVMSQFGDSFDGGTDYEKVELARKLDDSEFSYSENLGYISLTSALTSDEVLAVAYNYTVNGETFQVGEFSTDGIDAPKTLFVKLLKGTNLSPSKPTWDLMMKNIYSLNAYSLSDDDFELNILYESDSSDINYLPGSDIKGHILLQVMNLDMLNSNLDQTKNGIFDYVEGITVDSETGRIIFPVVEPFGSHLADSLGSDEYIETYAFQSLYDSTAVYAEQDAEHNRYILSGSYTGSSSSEISLGSYNVTKGSVTVSAGGSVLTENVDYTVDYTLGTVTIINEALLASGTDIEVSSESQDLFNTQTKTLLGSHFNYAFSDNFNLGGTMLYMHESSLTTKVDYGDDPVSNLMFGLDGSYTTESMGITNVLNALPFYNSSAASSFSFEGEYAKLIPGTSGATDGNVYIDDFESTETSIDMKTLSSWSLASTPQEQSDMFPEGELSSSLDYGINRAKLAFYNIDPLFLRNTSYTPTHIKNNPDMQSNHFVREVYEQEIFPDAEYDTGETTTVTVLNLAYYPEERGPYNFDDGSSSYGAGVNSDGTLSSPESRWGGIMREISTTDFESTNIQYIEFWLMDPFVNDSLDEHEGGDLYFNLGSVSEDILKDSRKAFENGLPTTDEVTNVDTTIWGRVSTEQSLVDAFDNSTSARQYQDIGFDGLDDEDEQSFYENYLGNLQLKLTSDAYEAVEEDPATDNYHYYRGSDYDDDEIDILTRYKKYNGPDGNSPTSDMSDESYSTSATTIPDGEDINDDNTLSEYESYYQYGVSLRREDMLIGENYITDVQSSSVELENGEIGEVNWYKFQIPINTPDATLGDIDDFSSIRFMRMFLTDFKDETHLRFATLDLVRADWREYTGEIIDDSDAIESSTTEFEISAVSIEENGSREPVNYILPPGVSRETDVSSSSLAQLDEQSLELTVTNLGYGDAVAAYKSLNMDFRNYKRLKMYVHAEEIEGYDLEDDEMYFFIRLGSDYNNNYYEYEIPLKLTPAYDGVEYDSDDTDDRYIVWPEANNIDLPLDALTDLKLARNQAISAGNASTSEVYEMDYEDANDGNNVLKIKGSPSFGEVEVLMIGIRNPKTGTNTATRSVEVWANELRLSGAESEGGWAANARMTAQLADLGSITVAAEKSTAGFGSIDDGINEVSMENYSSIDVSASIDWGRFFPEKAGVRVPMYYGYSKNVTTPEYNPYDTDIKLDVAIDELDTDEEKDSLLNLSQEVVEKKSINFTNVKIEPQKEKTKKHLWDPENLSLSYSYNEEKSHDESTAIDLEKTHNLTITYNYVNKPKLIEPFKKVKFLQKGPLKLIGDFNFYPSPTQIAFRTNLYRYYSESQSRSVSNPNLMLETTYDKDFLLKNYFDLRYDLTKSLKFDFSSSGTARIDEPEGSIDKDEDDYQEKKDSIISNLLELGRPTAYSHDFSLTYQVPIRKIKLLDFLSSTIRYSGTYDWDAGSLTSDESINLGNTVSNSGSLTVTSTANMQSLYNKVPYFKQVNQKYARTKRRSSSSRTSSRSSANSKSDEQEQKKGTKTFTRTLNLTADKTQTLNHRLNTKKVKVLVTDSKGQQVAGKLEIIDANNIAFTPLKSSPKAILSVSGVQGDQSFIKDMLDFTTRMALGVQSLNLSYSKSGSTYLPGYLPEPSMFGAGRYTNDSDWSGISKNTSNFAPGLPFLFGWQDEGFAQKAIDNGWVTTDTTLNSAFALSQTEQISLRGIWEPIPDLKINLTASRSFTKSSTEYYDYDYSTGEFESNTYSESGSFSMTTLTLGTAFFSIGKDEVRSSEAFENFKNYREIIANRLANQRSTMGGYDPTVGHSEYSGYPDGYGPNSVEVLVPAFLAAYQGKDPETTSLGLFPSLKYLRPNWTINYEGMVSKIPGLSKFMRSLNLEHSYKSTYNIGSFSSNLDYEENEYGLCTERDLSDDFVTFYDFSSVNITEAFNPLINLDVTWNSDFTTRAEINRNRSLTLSLSNNQLTEVLGNEYVVGIGYRFTQMDLIVKTKNSQHAYSNDLNIRADISFTKSKTTLRQLDEDDDEDQVTAGQGYFSLATYAEYKLSDQFEMKVYYDHIINNPYTSSSYRTISADFGVSFTFTLSSK